MPSSGGSVSADVNAKVKAIFLYNFSKYVEWPSDMSYGKFKIAILGDYPELISELTTMARVKKRGDRSYEIITASSLYELTGSHIIFIDKSRNTDFKEIVKYLSGSSTLVVTESDNFMGNGACINMYYENSKQKIEISPKAILKRNLRIKDQLLTIAKIVK